MHTSGFNVKVKNLLDGIMFFVVVFFSILETKRVTSSNNDESMKFQCHVADNSMGSVCKLQA